MKKPIISQRYVHKVDGHAMHVKSELTGGNYKTTRGMMNETFILANYSAQDVQNKPMAIKMTKEQAAAARRIYGSLGACFRAGLKAGGYNA